MTKPTDDIFAAMARDMMSNVKFFPRDVISGRADAVGDTFTAFFMTGNKKFRVTSHQGDVFYAEKVS